VKRRRKFNDDPLTIGFFLINFAKEKLESNGKHEDLESEKEFPFWKTFAREKTKKFPVSDNYDKNKHQIENILNTIR
jgi:hypothetical protein